MHGHRRDRPHFFSDGFKSPLRTDLVHEVGTPLAARAALYLTNLEGWLRGCGPSSSVSTLPEIHVSWAVITRTLSMALGRREPAMWLASIFFRLAKGLLAYAA